VAITLDILLPEIDGWEVLTRLKAHEATRDIPVVIASVIDNPALGRALGALDYFVKRGRWSERRSDNVEQEVEYQVHDDKQDHNTADVSRIQDFYS